MKNLSIPVLIILALIMGCSNDQKDTVNVDESNGQDKKTGSAIVAEKQAPVFTPSELPYPFSSAVQVGDILFLSGDIGVAENGTSVVSGGIVPETQQMFKRIKATLAQHGLGLDDVFKCTVMLADMSEWQEFNEIYAGYFKPGRYPTRSALGASGLALGARVEMECWAYNPQKDKERSKAVNK